MLRTLATLFACSALLVPRSDEIAKRILELRSPDTGHAASQELEKLPRDVLVVRLIEALQPGGALEGAPAGRYWAYGWLSRFEDDLPNGGRGIADPRVLHQLHKGVVERDRHCARGLARVAIEHRSSASLALGAALEGLDGSPLFVRQSLLSIGDLGEATPATVDSIRAWLADPEPARKDYWDAVRANEEDDEQPSFGHLESEVREIAAGTLLRLKRPADAELEAFDQLDACGQRAAYKAVARYGYLRELLAPGLNGMSLTEAHPFLGPASVAWLAAGWTTREMEDETFGMGSQAVFLALRRGVGDRAAVRSALEAVAAGSNEARRQRAQRILAALDAND